jgi:hypothetical protein
MVDRRIYSGQFHPTNWDQYRPRCVAVEWLEPASVKEVISSDVQHFLERQKYEFICKTPATLIFCENASAHSGRWG